MPGMTRAEGRAELIARHGLPLHCDPRLASRVFAVLGVPDPPPPDLCVAFLACSIDAADEWIRLTLAHHGPYRVLGPVLVEGGGWYLYGYDLRPLLEQRHAEEDEDP